MATGRVTPLGVATSVHNVTPLYLWYAGLSKDGSRSLFSFFSYHCTETSLAPARRTPPAAHSGCRAARAGPGPWCRVSVGCPWTGAWRCTVEGFGGGRGWAQTPWCACVLCGVRPACVTHGGVGGINVRKCQLHVVCSCEWWAVLRCGGSASGVILAVAQVCTARVHADKFTTEGGFNEMGWRTLCRTQHLPTCQGSCTLKIAVLARGVAL